MQNVGGNMEEILLVLREYAERYGFFILKMFSVNFEWFVVW